MRHLAYHVKIAQKQLSPQEILRALNGVQPTLFIHKKTGDRYRLPALLKREARMVYKALGLDRKQDAEIYLTP